MKNHLLPTVMASAIALSNATSYNAHAESFTLEEIVVTAQKRTENLQDVPISVSAMDGEKLAEAGIPNFEEFSSYVPNLNITAGAIADTVSIRGIQSGAQAGFEQSTGTYVDGVYRGRGTQSRFAFLDVGMVEVLRGPQGTLFGKNTIGGALNITSAAPTEEFEGEISLNYEVEHEEMETKGYISGPLSDSVRGRLAFLKRENDEGWVENSYYNQDEPENDEWAGRASIVWDVSDDLVIKAKYEHGDWDNNGRPIEEYILTPTLEAALKASGSDGTPDNHKTSIGNNTPGIDYGSIQAFEGDTDEAAIQMDYSFATGTLTAIAGYSEYSFDRGLDADFNSFDGIGFEEEEDYDQTSFELRFASELGNGFEYITGFYYQDSNLSTKAKSNFNVDISDSDSFGPIAVNSMMLEAAVNPVLVAFLDTNPVFGNNNSALDQAEAEAAVGAIGQFTRAAYLDQESESWAAFAQGTWDLTDTVRLTLGLRYGEEDKDAEQGVNCADWDTHNVDNTALNCNQFSLLLAEFTPHTFDDLHRDEEHWTYSANVQWDVTEDVMAYINMSTGVKSGGFNSFALTTNKAEAEFDEEKVKAYEIGAKMTLADGAAELNVAAFTMDYDDLQASIFTGSTGFKVENAATASISGFEMDGRWKLSEEFMLRGSLGYLDFEFDEYDNAGCTASQRQALGFVGLFTRPATGTTSGNATATGAGAFGAQTCEQDLAGGTNQYTPEWSASLSLEHEVELGNYFVRTVVDVNWMDDHYTSSDNDPLTIQDAYALTNLMVTFGTQNGDWDISLVGRNITDEEYITYSNDMPLFSGSQQVAWGREANYALRGRLRF